MPGNLLSLPGDLLVQHILARLDLPALRSCSSTCRDLNIAIKSSALVIYLVKLQEMGLIDNPAVSYEEMPLAKRSEMLREYYGERLGIRWKINAAIPPKLHNGYLRSIKGDAGVLYILPFFRTEAQELHWTTLPWKKDQTTEWNNFRPYSSANIAAIALSIEENDLVAFATWHGEFGHIRGDLVQIHFMQHSTRLPYPGLTSHIMDICAFRCYSMDSPAVKLAIRGTNLAVTVGHAHFQLLIPHTSICPCTGHLSVWNWKTGEKKCEKYNIPDKDMGMVFLKDDLLLHGSPQGPSLNIYHIPTNPSPGNYDLPLVESLGLPSLEHGLFDPRPGFNLDISFCDNPTAIPSFTESLNITRLFTTNNLSSILTIRMTFEEDGDCTSYLFVTHYQTLLGRAERALSHGRNVAEGPVKWEEWGPDATRVFWYDHGLDTAPIPLDASCGFRLFIIGQSNDVVEVYDFGPMTDGMNNPIEFPEESKTPNSLRWIADKDEPEGQGKWFKDIVHTKLPFVRRTFKASIAGDWDKMYVDQSRIVGIKESERIDVLYIG